MRTALAIPTALVVVLAALNGCARNSYNTSDVGHIAGASDNLQPQISTATTQELGALMLAFSVPQRSYVTVVRLLTQSSVSVMATSSSAATTTVDALDAGPHKLALVMVPGYVRSNGQRNGHELNRRDGTLSVTDASYSPQEYAVVVTTDRRLSVVDAQESLDAVDLRGPDDAVIKRVAAAIGAQSQGAWSASAAHTSVAMAPF